ncbi:MAG: VWA domain-containing protein [Gaiellales bacterium]
MIRRASLAALAAVLACAAGAQAAPLRPGSVVGVAAAGPHAVRVVVRTPGDLSREGVSARLGNDWATVESVHRLGHQRPLHLVFAVDTSGSMAGAPIAAAVESGQRLLDAVGSRDEVGLVTFSGSPQVVSPLTHGVTGVREALNQLSPSSGTALYDGILAAVQVAGRDGSARRVVVVLSDGADTASRASLARTSRALARSGVELDAVGLLDSGSYTAAPLRELTAATSGTFVSTRTVSGLAPLFARLSRDRLSSRYAVTFELPQTSARDLHVTVNGGTSANLTLPAGVSGTSPSLWSRYGVLLVALLGFGAALACSLVAFELAGRRQPTLTARLSPYSAALERDERKHRSSAVNDLSELVEQRLERRAVWRRLDALCEQAGTSVPTALWVFVICAAGAGAAILVGAALGPLGALAGLAAGLVTPLALLRFWAGRRARAFEAQLPDLLNVWASALRAGRSFSQALDTLVEEAGDPARGEFRRAQRQVRLGVPVEQALDDLSKRVRSESFELVVLTTDVQRRVGGNVAAIFDQVSETVRKRQQFSARVRALTSMGRMSANVLLAMPFVIAGLLTLINSDYMIPLYTTHTGHLLMTVALVMMGIGAAVLRKMVKPRAIA